MTASLSSTTAALNGSFDRQWERAMIGEHVLTLHETNRRGRVPVCSCGWIGLVQNTPKGQREPKGKVVWRPEISEDAATRAFDDHVSRCARPLVDRMNP